MPLDSPEESQDEVQEGAAAPEEGTVRGDGVSGEQGVGAFDAKTLKALLRVHASEDLRQGAEGVVKSVAKVLSLSAKDVTKAITGRVRTLREEVQYLLDAVGGGGRRGNGGRTSGSRG